MTLSEDEMRYTFADVLTWDERDRVEIIDGEAFMMSPPLRVHQSVLSALFLQIGNYLQGKSCKVYPTPFAVRPFEEAGDTPEDVDTMLEPDITIVCDPDKLDKYGCKGTPDMVIEILSPSTRRHDLVVKYRLYQRAGIGNIGSLILTGKRFKCSSWRMVFIAQAMFTQPEPYLSAFGRISALICLRFSQNDRSGAGQFPPRPIFGLTSPV